jgi:site-specific recombinase XerC
MKLAAIQNQSKLSSTRAALGRWSVRLSERTRREYTRDLEHAARFAELPSAVHLVAALGQSGKASAETFTEAWLESMEGAGLSTATMARRVSSLRSVVKLLRRLELVDWSLEARAPTVEQRHERKGPTASEARHMWGHLVLAGPGQLQARHRALWRLLWDNGLRISEALGLELPDIDIDGHSIAVRRKGKRERKRITIAPETAAALAEWCAVRPLGHGPALFLSLAEPYTGQALKPRAVRGWLDRLGRRHLGRTLSPHRLRHGACTAVLNAGASLRGVTAWGGWDDPSMAVRYDDARKDAGGGVARIAAALLGADGANYNDIRSERPELEIGLTTIVGKRTLPRNPKKPLQGCLSFGDKHASDGREK